MDFGVLGLVGSDNRNGAPSPSLSLSQTQTFPSAESKPKLIESGFRKQERSLHSAEEDEWKSCKFPKTNDFSTPRTNAIPLLGSNSLVSTELNQQDFSLLDKDGSFLDRTTQNNDHCYYQHPNSMHTRNAGYGSGTLTPGMHGVRGHMTQYQMIELQHQELIYKYIACNMFVPSNLLIPLKKSIYPYGFTSSTARPLAYNSLGWVSFLMGNTSSNPYPEPGRCRRTDGKKWRCSWDIVADQKYCERHLNRAPNRSRKPVEGPTGQAARGTINSKVVPMSSSMSASPNTIAGVLNNLAIARKHQFKNMRSGTANPSPDTLVNRMHDQRRLSVLPSATNLKSNNSTFSITKQGVALGESSLPDFGHLASGSLGNPSHRSYYANSKEHSSFLDITGQETEDERKSYRTQLPLSYHIETSSSSSLPVKEKHDISSLRLSREFDRVQMGSGLNDDISDQNKKQANLIPICLGRSMRGPLGEVLNNSADNVGT